MAKKKKKIAWGQVGLHIYFIITSLLYIVPMLLILSISFTGSNFKNFSLFPEEFSTYAYKLIFQRPKEIIDAYAVTFFYSIMGVITSLVINSMFAYSLSRNNSGLRKVLNILIFIPLVFGGGMVPHYLVISGLLHLNDTIWVYIIPFMFNAWTVIVFRTFFRGLPDDLFEAARLDGASELRICFNIAIPMSTPILATHAYSKFLGGWNDWVTCSIYVRKSELFSLQYVLKRYMDGAGSDLLTMAGGASTAAQSVAMLEPVKYAMAILGIGPAILIFPFIQKFYDKGIVMGSLKG